MAELHLSNLFAGSQKRQFRKSLCAWYDQHARDLPWRQTRDPYRVWLSEIMLQQTRVGAVIAHYHEFLRRFPTVEKLAAAREVSVLAAWSGLGYYRRARMLHAAAKVVVHNHGGKLPSTSSELRALPGVGRYTAAAIASISFGEPIAVVDGNVARVLERVSAKRFAGETLWQTASDLLDRKRPGNFNQAMMELGATVCTPRAPRCLACPLIELCAARGELAPRTRAVRQKKREIHYALIYRDDGRHGGEVFLVQRPRDASLMAGMWELPEVAGMYRIGDQYPWFTLRHSITVTSYTVHVWRVSPPIEARGKWTRVDRVGRIALTGLARKILRKAESLVAPSDAV